MLERSYLRRAAIPLSWALLFVSACSDDPPKPRPTTTTTTSTTTTTTSTTTTTVPTGPPAQLTGLATTPEGALRLLRPALAIKIDNSLEAMPQSGLNSADLVIELRVEGISRLMTVFHSNDSDLVGPTRSARFSDPDVLALFVKPLFGWSGANDRVTPVVLGTPWIVNVHWNRAQKEYFRRPGRAAPHNLYTRTPALFAFAESGQSPPVPIFDYIAVGQPPMVVLPVPGIALSVGGTSSHWVWDAPSSSWLRWQYGRRHESEGAGQVSAANVVVLETAYKDGKTSTAVTVGEGRAQVLTAGGIVEGRWSRPDRTQRFALTTADGQPIVLTPGRTWIELTPGRTTGVISAETASGLLAAG